MIVALLTGGALLLSGPAALAAQPITPVYADEVSVRTPLPLAGPHVIDPAHRWVADQLLVSTTALGSVGSMPGCDPTALARQDLALCGRPSGRSEVTLPGAEVPAPLATYQNGVLELTIRDTTIPGYGYSEQSQIEQYLSPADQPPLAAFLDALPGYDAYSTTSFPAEMKLRFSCPAAGYDGYVIQDTFAPPGPGAPADVLGNPFTPGAWQTWRYPPSTDTSVVLTVFTNSGLLFGGGNNVPTTAAGLIATCPDGVVAAVALSNGRYSSVGTATTLIDNVSFLGTIYDFQVRPAAAAQDAPAALAHTGSQIIGWATACALLLAGGLALGQCARRGRASRRLRG